MDLNPLIVTEHGAVVVDARIGVLPSPATARPYDHMAIHPYPSALRDRMELPGGVTATIRPIRPEDAAIESAFVHGLSEQSKFLRFMFGLQRPHAGDAVALHADRLRPRAGADRR